MASATGNNDNYRLSRLEILVEKNALSIQELANNVKKIKSFDEKFEYYRQASQWVVNLAFSLIAAATVAVIVSIVFKS